MINLGCNIKKALLQATGQASSRGTPCQRAWLVSVGRQPPSPAATLRRGGSAQAHRVRPHGFFFGGGGKNRRQIFKILTTDQRSVRFGPEALAG